MSSLFRVVLIFFCLFPLLLSAQARINSSLDWAEPVAQKHGLKGRVKAITQTQSPVTNKKTDWLDGHSGQNYSEEYNKAGFLVKRVSRYDYNEPQHITHYDYRSAGKISAIREESVAPNSLIDRVEGRIEYDFDSVKNVYTKRDKRVIGGKALNKRTETSVDSLKRVSTRHVYKQDTLLVEESRLTWDAHGYLTERASRFLSQSGDSFRLDKAELENFMKNELSMVLSDKEKKLLDSLVNTRDSLQRILPTWTGDTVQYRNQYDTKIRLVRQEAYRHNQLNDVVSFTYNAAAIRDVRQSYSRAGELISETISLQHPVDHHILSDSSRYKHEGKWETQTYNSKSYPKPVYQYKYDTHGNWIEQKQVDADGKQVGVALVRRIEYYP